MTKTYIKLVKAIVLIIAIPTAMILFFRYVMEKELDTLRTVMFFGTFFVTGIFYWLIMWLVKRKNIKYGKIKFAIVVGAFCWGIPVATLMNIVLNNPFILKNAIIMYILFIPGGFVWGIIVYPMLEKSKKKKKNNAPMA